MTVDELIARAEARIEADGYDPATVLAAALEALAESWADDVRPVCGGCGRRRVNSRGSLCQWCTEQHERDLHSKMKWWEANGSEWRAGRRQVERGAPGGQ
jgi:hypothetical protein